jgi:phage terminase large subunit-like protein
MFHQLMDPDSKRPLGNPADFAYFRINPRDNLEHITPQYLEILKSLSAAKRKRFLDGEYADADSSLLFSDVDIEKWRILDDELPAMVRIAVGVDPSGADDAEQSENDEIGIVAGGLGTDGNAYLLEDTSVKAGPGTWGKVVGTTYERHEANIVVGEGNFGGAMVEHVIQTARPRTPYKMVTATRGKMVRAEPFSALYEQGRVRHAGNFPKLEDELCQMSTRGYLGEGSPNRADAWIWVLAELFGGIVEQKRLPPKSSAKEQSGGTSFMAN